MASGTTADGCLLKKCCYIGSEISKRQVDFANNRLKEVLENDEIY